MEVRSCEWESSEDVDDTRETLDELYERRPVDGENGKRDGEWTGDETENGWHRSVLYGLYQERLEVYKPESTPAVHRLRLTRSLAVSNVRAVTVMLIGLVAVTLPGFDPASIFLYLILFVVLLGPDIDPPLSGLGSPVDRRIRPVPGLYAFATALVAAVWTAGAAGRPFGTLLALGIVIGAGMYLLSLDVVPALPVRRSGPLVRLQVTVLTRAALDLVAVFAFVVAADAALATLFWYLEVSEYEAAIQSSEIVAVAALELSNESDVRLILGAAAGFVLVFIAVWAIAWLKEWIDIAGYTRRGRSLTDAGIGYRRTRVVVGVALAVSQFALLLGAAIAATLLAQVLADGQLPAGLGTAAVEMLAPRFGSPSYSPPEGVLAASDIILDELAIVSGQTLAASLLALGLIPFAVLAVGTAYYLGVSAFRVRRLVADGRRVPTTDLETAVPVTAVIVDVEATVVRPVTTGFGRQQYVLVSESAAAALSSDEFDAVVLHASRHLAGCGRSYHALSLLLGLGGGGRNALLAVRDYATIEQTADDYALAHGVTADSLTGAIETLWEAKPYGQRPAVPSIHPTFVPTPVHESDTEGIQARTLRSPTQLLSALVGFVRDCYGWYFGPWIVDAVRQPVHARHRRLFGLESASESESDGSAPSSASSESSTSAASADSAPEVEPESDGAATSETSDAAATADSSDPA